MAVIHAGQLNQKVVLKVPSHTRDGGEKLTTYASLPAVKAAIERVSQQRAIETAPVLIDSEKVHVRYSSITRDIKKDWLVTYNGKDHTIHTIEVLGHNEFIKLLVKADG